MRELTSDLSNIFDDVLNTDPRFKDFSKHVINKVHEINVGGIFDDIEAELHLAFDPYKINIEHLYSDLPMGTGKIELRDDVRKEFKTFVRNRRGSVNDKYFVPHHDVYLEFYPDMLKDYAKMNNVNSQDLIDRYAHAVHAHVSDFLPEFDTKAAAFSTRYADAVEVLDAKQVNIGTDRSGRDTGRDALNVAMFRAYNFFKFYYSADYDMMHAIFPLETLVTHARHEIGHFNGVNEALETVNMTSAVYDEFDYIIFHNIGNTKQKIGLQADATTAPGSLGMTINKGKAKSFQIISLGTAGNHFLNTTNLDLDLGGAWKIEIYRET